MSSVDDSQTKAGDKYEICILILITNNDTSCCMHSHIPYLWLRITNGRLLLLLFLRHFTTNGRLQNFFSQFARHFKGLTIRVTRYCCCCCYSARFPRHDCGDWDNIRWVTPLRPIKLEMSPRDIHCVTFDCAHEPQQSTCCYPLLPAALQISVFSGGVFPSRDTPRIVLPLLRLPPVFCACLSTSTAEARLYAGSCCSTEPARVHTTRPYSITITQFAQLPRYFYGKT